MPSLCRGRSAPFGAHVAKAIAPRRSTPSPSTGEGRGGGEMTGFSPLPVKGEGETCLRGPPSTEPYWGMMQGGEGEDIRRRSDANCQSVGRVERGVNDQGVDVL
jgi:hypothetical protein